MNILKLFNFWGSLQKREFFYEENLFSRRKRSTKRVLLFIIWFMLQTLIFAFSISIDAFGYSLGFGSRRVKLRVLDFLAVNILNILILCLFLSIFPYVKFLSQSVFLEDIGNCLLLLFGVYYLFVAYKELFYELKFGINIEINLRSNNFLNFGDIALLLSIFFIENLFSTFIFYATLSGKYVFVLSIFLFHCLFFTLGFRLGNKLISKLPLSDSFVSGSIFILLALSNLV